MIEEIFFAQKEDLFCTLNKHCMRILHHDVELRGRASLLVSGGSTPAPLYQQLSQQALDWKHIDIALVDERWVAPGDKGSNQTFIENTLLKNEAVSAKFIPMKNSAPTAKAGEAKCNKAYQMIHFPFDLCILGMGPDGHTASLFPHAENLHYALDDNTQSICTHIHAKQSEVTGELTERMSLSLNAIKSCNNIILLMTGEEKLSVYKQALSNSDFNTMPISALLQDTNSHIAVYWAP
ncbi:MAG: 6-phosphogluconolactonase [Agarilytica sp.]